MIWDLAFGIWDLGFGIWVEVVNGSIIGTGKMLGIGSHSDFFASNL